MKKLISILTVFTCLLSIRVNAADFTDMTEKLMDYFKIEVSEDVSGINMLQNRRNIKKPELMSTAIKNGIIIAKNGLVNENGMDYTALTDGLIKRYINNENYKFVSGTRVDLVRNKNVKFDEKTFFVTENFSQSDLNYTDVYTCITDRENNAIFVWKSGDVIQPAIYKVKMYWLEKDELIVTEIYKKEFDLWIKESKERFYSIDSSQISVNQDFILENLDGYVYVFADNYGGKIKVKGISR